MFAFRTDVATLQPAKRMDDGRLVAEALITKPGIFEYPDPKYPGGIRRELRPDAEVYSRETMDSFASMPCTQGHPSELLTSLTAKRHMVGSTGDRVSREPVPGEPDWIKTKVMVADAPTIKRMDSGDNATSCGYACWIDERGGVDPKYGRFDVVQRNIRGNHLAVGIPAGRAGRLARVRMDAEVTADDRALAAKRADEIATYDDLAAAAPELVVMTTAVDGHQHTLDPADPSGCTSSATAEGAEDSHRHEFVRAVDGKLTIAENAGHTHDVDPSTIGVREDGAANHGGGALGGRFDSINREGHMNELEKMKEMVKVLEAGLKASETETADLKTRLDAAEQAAGEAHGVLKTVEQERDALKVQIAAGASAVETEALVRERTRADQADAKVARFDETVESLVESRADLQFRAAVAMGPEFKMRGLTDRQIMAAVVKRLDAAADVSDAVELGYIKGRFDSLLKLQLQRARQDANVSAILGSTAQTARADSKADKMREYREQWKKPLHEVLTNKKGA